MNIIFDVRGGIGKVIASTAFVDTLRQRYSDDKLIVVSSYPEIFKNNFNVDNNYHLNDIGLVYNKFIKNQSVKFYIQDPYMTNGFMNREMNINESYHTMYDAYHISRSTPKIYIDNIENDIAKAKYESDKPIFVLHTHGGNEDGGYNWAKDLPDFVINKIINKFKNDYTIYHIRQDHQPTYKHTITANEDIRSIATLIQMSEKRLFVDSFAQHMARALYKKSTVCWIATSPKNFGYDFHDNILCNAYEFEMDASHYQQYNLRESINNLPFQDEERIFDVDEIIKSIKQQ